MATAWDDFHVPGFWKQSEYAYAEYVGLPPTDETVAEVERELGYKLPASYVAFMRVQNGGIPRRTCHRTAAPTSWSADHVTVAAFWSIGGDKSCSLLGDCGSQFWVDEWGYLPIGVYFADTPTAGHEMFCLDYSACGPAGEPQVVHVDQERDYAVTVVAETFESFVRGLQDDSAFRTD